jgi:amidase
VNSKVIALVSLCFTLLPQLANGQNILAGRYLFTVVANGTPLYRMMTIAQDGTKLSGTLGGAPIEGTIDGAAVILTLRGSGGYSESINGTIHGETVTGSDLNIFQGDPAHRSPFPFTATPVPNRPAPSSKVLDYVPLSYSRTFSALNKPVLTVAPGDTVRTATIDAAGMDKDGKQVSLGGNPLNGPFFIISAMPGDTLAIHIVRLRLNRDWAASDDYVVDRAANRNVAIGSRDNNKSVWWHLDLAGGFASPEKPDVHVAAYQVPLRPMLGCIAVAPPPVAAVPASQDSGNWGGNIDFNEIVEGSTVYLPVNNPGALLYIGDAHAAMGDGEINGNALETSMDVEFTVDVIPGRATPAPRVETNTAIMATGYEGSLDDALKSATANMNRWLSDDYKLNPSEIAQVLGTSAQYRISEVADRNAGVALIIDKSRLASLIQH